MYDLIKFVSPMNRVTPMKVISVASNILIIIGVLLSLIGLVDKLG